MTTHTEQQPVGQLVNQLSEQVSTLVRDELTLARMEMVEKGKRAGTGAGLLGGAGVIALYGVGALFVTIGALLALVLPVWAAALIVTVVLFAVAGIAALIGKKQVKQAVPPEPIEAMESGKRDVEAVKTAFKEGRHS
ncbi:membrane protein [Paractinoplanes abujensis]|uniref:Putative membrane protein YqjE n=1 Tax=Paractinoplanes abujensis TaxID=882441 RepID=A0A7W7D077_9ACTN|nr:phage holin family protein [Actinoplanes abujensis]MBB4696291.1 putative membrane protein YqjE [Actinoplanes abujensis]GID22283.1 membrane protein [Actinoplanes abujensis]